MPTEHAAFGPVAPYYDELMAGVPYRFWVRYLAQLWERHGLAPRSILDLACGTGRVSRLLAGLGYDVVGVDLSAAMLERARQEAALERLPIDFVQQDAAELDLGERRFDAVISLFDSLNYILEPERLASAFAHVQRHLHPGGSFIFDLNTEYALAAGMFNQSSARKGEALHYRWRSRYDPEARLCVVSMRFSYDTGAGERQVFHETHRQRAYHKEEIVGWLRDAGFSEAFVYDSYTTEPPKKRSDRLFFVALKPPSPYLSS
ncbi:MAG: class I SAM-dependent methyltransferase [Armatimonadetes bacterium]|nr:class I SAM-dependent methyltransferase [Armatimonadota bacterium]